MIGASALPLRPSVESLAAAYRDVLTGRCLLMGWGAVANLRYHQWQCLWPLSAVLDSDSNKVGQTVAGVPVLPLSSLETADPAFTVVMVFPEALHAIQSITGFLVSRGFTRVIPPFQVECDAPALRAAATALVSLGRPVPAWIAPLLQGLPDDESTIGGMVPVPAALEAALQDARPAAEAVSSPDRRAVTLASEQMILGGSERQICYLASGMTSAGYDTELVTLGPRNPGTERLEDRLLRAGVPHHRLPQPRVSWLDPVTAEAPEAALTLVRRLPVALMHPVLVMRQHLLVRQPQAVVAYMERMGVIAALAGLMAGVPRIVISLRSLDPGHFVHYFPYGIEWFRQTLAWLATLPEIQLCANSAAGARACARWLELPEEAIPVVHNAAPDAEDRADAMAGAQRLRDELNIPLGTPVIAGVFRLVPEKRPSLFFEVVRRLIGRHPRLRVVLAGDGPLRAALDDGIQSACLTDRVHLLGPRPDGTSAIALGDLLLHTAAFEGMPNVHLEAQALGRPVVCLEVGGTAECLTPSLRPYALPPGGADEVDRLVAACDHLLRDKALRAVLGSEGQAMADRAASPRTLAENTLRLCGLP